MKTVEFDPKSNPAGVAKAIHGVMQAEGWSMHESQAAMQAKKVKHVEEVMAEKLKKVIEGAAANDVRIVDE